MSGPDRIEVDQFVPHAPDKVWRALTDADLMARWLMPNDFKPITGHRFTFQAKPMPGLNFGGTIHCEVLAVEHQRLLRISWADPEGSGLDTVVTWQLVPEGRGTRLVLEHSGFDTGNPFQLVAFRSMGSGWRSTVLERFVDIVAEPESN